MREPTSRRPRPLGVLAQNRSSGFGRHAAAALAALLAACASYDGSGLVVGQSRATDVEARMGAPDEKLASADGGSIWFYTRPSGGHSFAVELAPDGIVRKIDSRLTEENIAGIRAGVTSRAQVRALLGPPHFVSHLDRQQREVWEYKRLQVTERRVLWVQFSDDGLVREVLDSIDHDYLPASDSAVGKD